MIRFDDVTMVYTPGAQPALDHVSLEVEREEFVFLVGKSGSGKSTFLQLVMREMKATSGKVWVLGKDVSKLSTWQCRNCAVRLARFSRTSACCPPDRVRERRAGRAGDR